MNILVQYKRFKTLSLVDPDTDNYQLNLKIQVCLLTNPPPSSCISLISKTPSDSFYLDCRRLGGAMASTLLSRQTHDASAQVRSCLLIHTIEDPRFHLTPP